MNSTIQPSPRVIALTACLLAGGVFAAARPAHAEPSAADRESARSLMNEGDKKLAARDARGAMKAYQTAHEIMRVPSTGASYAQAALEAGFYVEARDACLQVARIATAPNEPPAFQKARAACTDLVPKADAKIATVTIKWEPLPGAGDPKVAFDGAAIPSGALLVPRKVNPGKHVISATLSDYEDERTEVTAAEAGNIEITLTFKKRKGGAAVATTPASSNEASGAGASDTTAKGRSPLVYVGFGIGAAGFLVGGVTGGLSLSKASDAKAGCVDQHCPRSQQDVADSSRTLGTVSNIGFGVGLVGVGLGVYGLLAGGKPTTATTSAPRRILPVVGVSSLGVQGQF